MKKCLFLALFSIGCIANSAKAEPLVLASKWGVDLLAPGSDVSGCYAFDLVSKRNLVGVETPVAKWKNLYGVIGLAADVPDAGEPVYGIPIIGGHMAGIQLFNQKVDIGALIGRDFKNGVSVAGVKASARLW